MNRGRRIAFDYGDARIGVAVTDLDAILATPIDNLDAAATELSQEIRVLLDEYLPLYIAIGSPIHLSGEVSAKSASVNSFCALIRSLTELPIYLIDERLTTVTASKNLRAAGVSAKDGKSKIDGAAAVAILESALHAEAISGNPSKVLFV
jgi:putative Holliday junction resolvase